MNMSEKPSYEDLEHRVRELEQSKLKMAEALRESEEKLKQERERLRFIMEGSHFGTWAWNVRTNEMSLDTNWAEMLGYSLDELSPCNYEILKELVHKDDLRMAIRQVNLCMERESRDYKCELRMKHKDGHWVWILAQGRIMSYDDKGQPLMMFGVHINITERKRAEDRMALLGRMLDEAPASVTVHSYDGTFLFSNRHNMFVHGYEVEEAFLKINLRELDAPDSSYLVTERLRQLAETGEARFETVHYRKDGSTFPLEVMTKTIKWQGEPAILSIAVDITERKKAEEAVREQNSFLRKVIDTIPAFVCVKTITGHYALANRALSEAYGTSVEVLEGLTDGDFSPLPEEINGFLEDDRKVITSKKTFVIPEEKITYADGSVHWLSTIKTPLVEKDGTCDRLLAIAMDITERRQAEAERARLISAVGQAAEIFMITDVQGTIQYVNPAFERITGYSVKEVLGQNPRVLKSGKQDEGFYRNLWKTILSGSTWQGRLVNKKKDNSLYVEDATISPVFNNEGVIVGFVAVKRDISEEMKMKEHLAQSQKMESIGVLAGGIAHDFNNILSPVIGLAELLTEDLPAGSVEHENVQEILKAGLRGSDLAKQILAFSRQAEHKMMPVRIQLVLKEVVKLARSTIPSYIDITQYIQSDCGLVMGDPTQIHQIALNLMTNAFHAVEATGGKIHVKLKENELNGDDVGGTNLKPGRYALFSVSDTGCGINPEAIGKIFDPYFTTKDPSKGTGLGLAVVYGIVKEHKGDIKVSSEIGKGTTVDVYFPLIEKSSQAEFTEKVEILQTGTEKILLVDDEEAIVILERQMLERLGYQISCRTSSPDALKAFSADPSCFDLVITDMTMPNMTGDQLARKLILIRPSIPIIICTGFSERVDEQRAKELGIKGILKKPIVRAQMAKMVRKVLDETKKNVQTRVRY